MASSAVTSPPAVMWSLLRFDRSGHGKAHRGARKRHVRILEHGNTPQNAIQNSRYIVMNIAFNEKCLCRAQRRDPVLRLGVIDCSRR